MGVYINMEMPESCDDCRLNNGISFYAVPEYTEDGVVGRTDDRPGWCPLVPVPSHGRLIDADALIKSLSLDEDDAENGASLLMAVFLEVLKSAPTIIQASKEVNK